MRRNLEPIEIQDPPIQELGKKHSCLKRTCATGCGCVVIFIVSAFLLLKFVASPRSKELKQIPADFPAAIPLYDQKEINKITFISGKDKSRGMEIAAYAPKLVLSAKTSWSDWLRLIKEPVTDHRDLYQIEWSELMAEPRFLSNYFKSELEKNKFIVEKITDTERVKQFRFASTTMDIDGIFYLEDDSQNKGTDYVSLTVNAPSLNE